MKLDFLQKTLLFLSGTFLLVFLGCASRENSSQFKKLVWSDEFNYKGLPDSTKWNYDVGGHGFGNNEAQFYTKKRLENARVENGNLIIEAKKENWEGKNYTSARLVTKGKQDWKYGRIEVKAKLPKGRGNWPAIWMLSTNMKKWPQDGELDIMEHVGYHHGFVHASAHTGKYNWPIGTQKTDTLFVKDLSEKFHVYKADWSPEKIDIYVDDNKFFTYVNTEKTYEAWPFDQKLYLILNLAIGGNWGGQQGIDDSIFPQKMYIDYVRIYQ
jgi:beta-glucanase (GH16 family)